TPGRGERVGQVAVRLRRAGIDLQRGAELRDPLLDLPLPYERNPEVVVHVGRCRDRRQGPPEMVDGLDGLVPGGQQGRGGVVRLGIERARVSSGSAAMPAAANRIRNGTRGYR